MGPKVTSAPRTLHLVLTTVPGIASGALEAGLGNALITARDYTTQEGNKKQQRINTPHHHQAIMGRLKIALFCNSGMIPELLS